MTATTPRPIRKRDQGRRPDIETDLAEHYHVEFSYVTGVPTSDFDIDKSLHNQARFQPIDEETVELYKEGVERGDPFPAVIAWRPGRSANAKLVVIDGNHRVVAHDRAGEPIDVYEVDRATKPQTIALMTFAFNTRHGKATTEEERIYQAIYLIDNGASEAAAAAAVNIPKRILTAAMTRAKADRRADEVGVDRREWDHLHQSVKSRLMTVSTDEGFHDAVHLAFVAQLGIDEVKDLVPLLNTSRSGTKQRAIVKAEAARLAERIQAGAAGTLDRPSSRKAMNPKARLGLVLGQLMALPDDPGALSRSFTDSERNEAAGRVLDASERLRKLALAIDPSLK